MLELRLLGPGEVRLNGRMLPGFPHKRPYLLLCVLLINRQFPISRERLAAAFWSDYSADASRKYLRQMLWQLRQALRQIDLSSDTLLLISDDAIAMNHNNDYWLDLAIFEDTLHQYISRPANQLLEDEVTEIEHALSYYKGDLLEDVYEDWCICERERLCLLYVNMLEKLMSYYDQVGDYDRGIACGERILTRDPVREHVHRIMMHMFWRAGRRHAAIAQYKQCLQILRDELDTQPMVETVTLYDQMMNGRLDTAISPSRSASYSQFTDGSVGDLVAQAMERFQQLKTKLLEMQQEASELEQLLNTLMRK